MKSDLVANRVARLESVCSERGIALTPQRRAVMEVIAPRTDHPTVEQVYSSVVERVPGVSKATVYRALDTLTRIGLLRRVDHPGSAVRFDPNTAQHHHFLCTACGELSDLPLEDVAGYEGLGYCGDEHRDVQDLAVLVRGTCERCAR